MNFFQLFWIVFSIGGSLPVQSHFGATQPIAIPVTAAMTTPIAAIGFIRIALVNAAVDFSQLRSGFRPVNNPGLINPGLIAYSLLQVKASDLILAALPRLDLTVHLSVQPWAISSKLHYKTAVSSAAVSAIALDSMPSSQTSSAPASSNHILKFVEGLSHWSGGVSAALRLNSEPLVSVVAIDQPSQSLSSESLSSKSPALPALSSLSIKTKMKPSEQSSKLGGSSQLDQSLTGQSLTDQSLTGQSLADQSLTDQSLADQPKDCLSLGDAALGDTAKLFQQVFQIKVRGKAVAEVPTQSQAGAIARHFEQVLQAPDFDPSTLSVAMIDGEPVGKAGEQSLFSIDSEFAAQLNRNSELIAIAWINNLRAALNTPTLSLTEAQVQMHDLTPTAKHLKGNASWYAPNLKGQPTATGEVFNATGLTAAHPSLPFDTYLKVTNLETGNAVIVRVNDRGPYLRDRSLDLSPEAAHCLNSKTSGVVPYEATVMKQAGTEQAETEQAGAGQAGAETAQHQSTPASPAEHAESSSEPSPVEAVRKD